MFKKISYILISILLVMSLFTFAGCIQNTETTTNTHVVTNADGSKITTVTSENGETVITTEYTDGSVKKQTNKIDGTVVIETKNADGSVVTVTMDAAGNSVTITTDKTGNTTIVKIEKKADGTTVTTTEKADGTKTEVVLDANGAVVNNEDSEEKEPEGETKDPSVTYEDGNAIVEISNEDGSSVKITLDGSGNSTTVTTDKNGNKTTVSSQKQADGTTVTTTENPDGSKNVVKIAADGSLIEEPAPKGERALPIIRITTTNPKDPEDPLAFVTEPIGNTVKIHSTTGGNTWGMANLLKPSPWYEECKVSVEDEYHTELISDAKAEVKSRGNYTTTYDKKGLRIKFNKKKSVLGMHEGKEFKNWVLIASWKDYSIMRDYTAYKLAKLIDSKYYATDCKLVEVYINDNYWGVYLLVEQQEAKRVGITDAKKDDGIVETGYLLEYDSYAGVVNGYSIDGEPLGEDGFNIGGYGEFYDINYELVTYANNWYTIKSDYDEQKKTFITNYMAKLWEICRESIENHNYKEFNADNQTLKSSSATTTEECISKVVDIDSLVDTFILQEIACDLDLHWSSFYMDLDLNPANTKKLTFEAPWDFDSAFGNHKERQLGENGISHLVSVTSNLPCDGNPWTIIFGKEEWFQDKVRAKWAAMNTANVKGNIIKEIETIVDDPVYAEAFLRNYYKWGHPVVDELPPAAKNCKTEKEAATVVINFIKNRWTMLETEFTNFKSSNKVVTTEDECSYTFTYGGKDPEYMGTSFTDTLKVVAKTDGLHIWRTQDPIWNHSYIYVHDETSNLDLPWFENLPNNSEMTEDKRELVYRYVEAGHIYSVWLASQRSYKKADNSESWEAHHTDDSRKLKVRAIGGLKDLYIDKSNYVFDKQNKTLSYDYFTLQNFDTPSVEAIISSKYYSVVLFDRTPWVDGYNVTYAASVSGPTVGSKTIFQINDTISSEGGTINFWDGKDSGGIIFEYVFSESDTGLRLNYRLLEAKLW